MTREPKESRRLPRGRRFALFFLLPALPIWIAFGLYERVAFETELQSWRERLERIADRAPTILVPWWHERLADARFLGASPILRLAFLERLNETARAEAAGYLSSARTAFGYAAIQLVDLHGTVVASDGPSLSARDLPGLLVEVEESRAARQRLDLRPALGPVLVVVQPLADPPGESASKLLGALVFFIDIDAALPLLVGSEPLATKTGETVLAVRDGSDLVFFSRLRKPGHDRGLRFSATEAEHLPVAAALAGRSEFREATDYAGDRVLAATATVHELGWGVVRKIDRREALSPFVRRLALEALVALLLTLAIGAMLSALYHRRVARLALAERERLSLRDELDDAERAQRRLSRLLDGTDEGVLLYDASDLVCRQANRTACAALGFDEREIGRRTLWEIAPELERDATEKKLDQLRDGSLAALEIETDHQRRDGTRFPVRLRLSLLEIEHRPLLVAHATDVTERRRLEEQLAQSQRLESVGRLAGGVAHDFNNLLTIITGSAELAALDLAPDAPARNELAQVREAARRGAELTSQLLAFSRRQISQPVPTDVYQLLAELEPLLRRMIGEDVELELRTAGSRAVSLVDRSQFDQIVTNLAINARDAMPRGGRLTVEAAVVELDAEYGRLHPVAGTGPHVRVAVSDTGEGMDEATRARIFEPFFTTKGPGKGSGLGLSTVYGIVRQSGGSIEVYTEPGQGATFKIYLPLVEAEVEPVVEVPEEAIDAIEAEARTILVVEDDPPLRHLTVRMLERARFQVLSASGGEEAHRASRAHDGTIDLLLTDVVMPRMSGKGVAERLRVGRPLLRVLYMSGFTDNAIVQHGILDCDVGFLQKPFSSKQLIAAVRRALATPPRD